MPEIALGYGHTAWPFVYEAARWRVLASNAGISAPLSDAEIGAALDNHYSGPALEEIIEPDTTVLLVVSDATRATGSAQIVHLIVRRLIAGGVRPGDIRIIFATGIHRAVTAEEARALLSPFIFQRVQTLAHNALDPAQHINLGVTERGTPIELNRALTEHDHIIITGGIGWHYFAGFTGGRKSICPGLASSRTIAATHSLALDFTSGGRRAGVGTGLLAGNAVHEECVEIAARVQPAFAVNAETDARGRVVRIWAGDWRVAHEAACRDYADSHSAAITEKRPLVITSCGGAPYDINLIQAHKALETASHACLDGGTIIWLAECAEGLGRADFAKWFDVAESCVLAERLREDYAVNGQTAWSLLTKSERFRVILVSSLAADEVRRMKLIPAQTLAEALTLIATDEEGYIMPQGAACLPQETD